jgi:predicted transcriptional regulator
MIFNQHYEVKMAVINLPKEMLQKDAYRTLPPKEKEEYLDNFLKQLLELNPEGITITQVKEATGFPSSTIWHHLEVLKSTGQARKISHGNVDVYHSNWRL